MHTTTIRVRGQYCHVVEPERISPLHEDRTRLSRLAKLFTNRANDSPCTGVIEGEHGETVYGSLSPHKA